MDCPLPPSPPLPAPPPRLTGTLMIPSAIMYCMLLANSLSLTSPSAHHRAPSLIHPGIFTAPAVTSIAEAPPPSAPPPPALSTTTGISVFACAAPPRFSNRRTAMPRMPSGMLAANSAPTPDRASVTPEADAITPPSSCTSDTSYSAATGLSLRNTSVMLNPNTTSSPDLISHGSHPTDTLNCPLSTIAPSGACSPASRTNFITPVPPAPPPPPGAPCACLARR